MLDKMVAKISSLYLIGAVALLKFSFCREINIAEVLIYLGLIFCTTAYSICRLFTEERPKQIIIPTELKKDVDDLKSKMNVLQLKEGFNLR